MHLQSSFSHRFGIGLGFSSDIQYPFPTVAGLSDSFLLIINKMSFWKDSPGPTWWDCIETLNPCISAPYGLSTSNLGEKPRTIVLSKEFNSIQLSARYASELERFLKDHFTIYPRCRISLTKERIRQGFLQDNWIGVGIVTMDKQLIACCISKPLGQMKFPHETVSQGGIVDYFCVHTNYRKQGFASFLLNELVFCTAQQDRLIHIFLKEGFPLWNIPPVYHSQYISRRRTSDKTYAEYFGSQGLALHQTIKHYSHAEYLPLTKFVANLPSQLHGDSELFIFNYKGHVVFLCVTDLHHRTVPEGDTVGEIAWVLPQTIEVPLSIQRLAVEACVDSSKFDIVLLDSKIPHKSKKGWQKDATYSWYLFNYNPGGFFSMKPFWIL